MILLRRSTRKDLEAYIAFSEEASMGITTLPQNPMILEQRLKEAEKGFKTGVFLFSLEWNDQVIGSSGITAHRGVSFPLHAYQIRKTKLKNKELNIDRQIDILHFHTIKTYPTELGSLFLRESFRGRGLGSLLSYGRLLFIAEFRSHFAPVVMTELRGISDNDGHCPFWEAVGYHFYHADFRQADYLRIAHPKSVDELFPHLPIYCDLLPQEAQKSIGKTHPQTEPARKLLEKQGFINSNVVDLFDAGPHLYAPTHKIEAVRNCRIAKVHEIKEKIDSPMEPILIANRQEDFRATSAPILGRGNKMTISEEVAHLLHLNVGDEIRYTQTT